MTGPELPPELLQDALAAAGDPPPSPDRDDVAMRIARAFSAAPGVTGFATITGGPWRQEPGQYAFDLETDEGVSARVTVAVTGV